jgi:hypothetical protein
VTVTFNPQITYREEIIGKPRPYEPSVQVPKEGSGTGMGAGGVTAGAVRDADTPSKPKLSTDLTSNPYLSKIKQSPNPTGGKDWWVKTGQKGGENGDNRGNGENTDFENLPAEEDFAYEESNAPETKEEMPKMKEVKLGNMKEEVKEVGRDVGKEVVKEVVKEVNL